MSDHESILKACLEDPVLRETLRHALADPSPDRLQQLGRSIGRLHSRMSSVTDRFSSVRQSLNEAADRVRNGYHDATTKGDSDVDSNS